MEKWKPERKIVAGAVATVALYVAGLFGVVIPPEVAASLVVVVGYFVPNK